MVLSGRPEGASLFEGRVGARLCGHRLVRRMGSGADAEVWQARCDEDGSEVALKIPRGSDPDRRARLLREALVGGRLRHPNVVAVHGALGGDLPCVRMELVRGPTLRAYCERTPSLSRVLELGLEICAGLAHLHDRGWIHRDIKPSNLLIDVGGRLKIADLGAAQAVGEPAPFVGTPSCAAPEQWRGRAEPRSDLYAMGVVLAWMSLGRFPFGTGVEAAVGLRGPRSLASWWREALDTALDGLGGLVAELLAPSPSRRPRSAAEVSDRLSELLLAAERTPCAA